jgi:hypothetical protein
MDHRVQPWRSGSERVWLAMLVDTMEELSRPEFRAVSCDPAISAELCVHLARPASPYPHNSSEFSLRN